MAQWAKIIYILIIILLFTKNDIYEWTRDHRVHHKYSETNADPHNSRRGFFFAHMGWLLVRKHPAVAEKGRQIDLSDVWDDPIVRFQRRFYIPLVLLFWAIIPISLPYYLWDEPLIILIFGNFFRYVMSLHQAWLVNSAAHIFGGQYYDKAIQPRENRFVTYLSNGEGYHNFHHTFPWHYSASENGWAVNYNLATLFIDVMAWCGLVTDRRVVSRKVIEQRIARTGDTSLMPPSMTSDRKPKSTLLDYLTGIIFITWAMWLSFGIRWFFYPNAPESFYTSDLV